MVMLAHRGLLAATLLTIAFGTPSLHAADSALENILAGGTLEVGTTGERDPMTVKRPDEIVEAPARDFREVLAGRADARITPNVEAGKLVAGHDSPVIVPVAMPCTRPLLGMHVPRNDQVRIDCLGVWIRWRSERGPFDELAAK